MEISRLRFEIQRDNKTSLDWNRLLGFTTKFLTELCVEYNLPAAKDKRPLDNKLLQKVIILHERVAARKEQLALLDLYEVEKRINYLKKPKR